MKISSADRFSNRVKNYIKYRPGYPGEMLELFSGEMGLRRGSSVADIGCGTGVSSKPFLEFGCGVTGIEPNANMREGARAELGGFSGFRVVDGSADQTGLGDDSVDLVVAAQAFHWFSDAAAVAEFRRIVKQGGFAALIWNERRLDADEFHIGYEKLLLEFGTDYSKVRHDRITSETLSAVFEAPVFKASFRNEQVLDLNGLRGRMLSASYIPGAGDPRCAEMLEKLRSLFAEHREKGKIQVLYDTNVFFIRV